MGRNQKRKEKIGKYDVTLGSHQKIRYKRAECMVVMFLFMVIVRTFTGGRLKRLLL